MSSRPGLEIAHFVTALAPAEFQIRCLDNPNASGVETRPLDFMDQVSSVREAKLIVAPIAMAALAVGDVERASGHMGIAQLDVSIVIGTKEPHIHGQTSLLPPFAEEAADKLKVSSHASCGQRWSLKLQYQSEAASA